MQKLTTLKILQITILILVAQFGLAQDKLNLQDCIDLALENSLTIDQQELLLRQGENDLKQNKYSRLPTLNAGSNFGYNFGKTIDPTTNTFDDQQSNFQSISLSAGMPIYQGGLINKRIEQSVLNLESTKYQQEAIANDIQLLVVQRFLGIMQAEDNLKIAQNQIANSQAQLDRIKKLINAGSVARTQSAPLEAQVARDNQQIILAQNQITLAKLNLAQILLLDNLNFEIIRPDLKIASLLDDSSLSSSTKEIYETALNNQPNIKASEIALEATKKGEELARTLRLPTLTLGASLGSQYSSLSRQVDPTSITNEIENRALYINGMEIEVGFPSQSFTLEKTPYTDQLNNNLGYGFNARLSVPILNGFRAKTSEESAHIATERSRIQMDMTKQELLTNVTRAKTEAQSSKLALDASILNRTAQQTALEASELRMNQGAGSNYEYLQAKNNLIIAENNEVQAKYNYIFALKVLDFYLNKKLTF